MSFFFFFFLVRAAPVCSEDPELAAGYCTELFLRCAPLLTHLALELAPQQHQHLRRIVRGVRLSLSPSLYLASQLNGKRGKKKRRMTTLPTD